MKKYVFKMIMIRNDLFITLIVGSKYPNDTCLSPFREQSD